MANWKKNTHTQQQQQAQQPHSNTGTEVWQGVSKQVFFNGLAYSKCVFLGFDRRLAGDRVSANTPADPATRRGQGVRKNVFSTRMHTLTKKAEYKYHEQEKQQHKNTTTPMEKQNNKRNEATRRHNMPMKITDERCRWKRLKMEMQVGGEEHWLKEPHT